MQQLRLAVRELLLVVDGDLLLDHHLLLLQVDLLLLLDQRVGLDLRVGGCGDSPEATKREGAESQQQPQEWEARAPFRGGPRRRMEGEPGGARAAAWLSLLPSLTYYQLPQS